ncbi:hypothetical protein [Candidatus Thiodiazotropha sp. CDECU1]|uniref:hypothetical protein n=1 Tax=Candidatus Thiodiazotropha sp. CDECU1 TaxID=3065865 RepID=UPI00292FA9F3|nr:hypothetical protein [Candidatus Thiodiazotropha sp. CDECU1]
MKINKAQIMQLESWKRIKDKEKLSLSAFLSAQPKTWWVMFVIVFGIWLVSELTNTSSVILRAFGIGSILFTVMLYIRVKLYWPITRHCINWEKVDELLRNKNT